ncbi:LOW QUALITY PROTEIN: hypothetical protein U9M48_036870, partial [Paspalum notatum var. saurae]
MEEVGILRAVELTGAGGEGDITGTDGGDFFGGRGEVIGAGEGGTCVGFGGAGGMTVPGPLEHTFVRQSTGCASTGAHSVDGFCSGRSPLMQLLVSLSATGEFTDGMQATGSTVKKLYAKLKFASAGSLQTRSATAPASWLLDTSSCSSLVMLTSPSGSVPTSAFPLTSTTVELTRSASSGGMQPSRRLLRSTSWSSVPAMRPTLRGMHPTKALFASTTTVAVELPRFSGMTPTKRLLLTKMASRSLSKSCGGRAPSKPLYRRSRYLSNGMSSTTAGKPPTKRLLLTSSSWRSDRRLKLLGMMPQKRLELMWKKAMSAELGGEVARDVAAVEVDARDDGGVGVVERRRARHAEVGAHVGADPPAGEVLRVGVDGAAPGLERGVRAAQAAVGEGNVDADVELEVVGEVAVAFPQGQQLPPRDVGRLRVRERGRREQGVAGGEEVHDESEAQVDRRGGAAGGLHCWRGKGQCGRPPLAVVPIWRGEDIGLRRGENMHGGSGGARVPEVAVAVWWSPFFRGKGGTRGQLLRLSVLLSEM